MENFNVFHMKSTLIQFQASLHVRYSIRALDIYIDVN